MYFLIGLHAGLGELGALAFLWVVIEMMNPTDTAKGLARLLILKAYNKSKDVQPGGASPSTM